MEITSRNYSSASADDAVERKAKRGIKRGHYSKKRSKTIELRATMAGKMKRSKYQFDFSWQPLFGFKNSSLALIVSPDIGNQAFARVCGCYPCMQIVFADNLSQFK